MPARAMDISQRRRLASQVQAYPCSIMQHAISRSFNNGLQFLVHNFFRGYFFKYFLKTGRLYVSKNLKRVSQYPTLELELGIDDLGIHEVGYSRRWVFTKLGNHEVGYSRSWVFTTLGIHEVGYSRHWVFTKLGIHDVGYSRSWV